LHALVRRCAQPPPRACASARAAAQGSRTSGTRYPPRRRKDTRDGKGDKYDENELREKWHPEENNWDYTANNDKVEKIDFVHGAKWGLNSMSAGGQTTPF